MIVGAGVDIVKISRIERILTENRDGFLRRIFTAEEVEYIKNKNYNAQTISGLFAAKEAVAKLLGTGIGKVNWKHINICYDEKGKPYVRLNGQEDIMNHLNIDQIHVSISHEKEYAVAMAIGENYERKIRTKVPQFIKDILPEREKDSHKGTYGRVGIIAGSKGMTGAPYLTSMACLRAGSGLVYTIVPEGISSILAVKLAEAIIKPVFDKNTGVFKLDSIAEIEKIIEDMDVLAIGPGMGIDEERIELVKHILLNFSGPVVLDADGLNCISKIGLNIFNMRRFPTIITPHPGEFSRLLGISIKEIQKNRAEYAKYVSTNYGIITVLKGAGTVVSNPKGEVYINTTGNPGMATAGSGDVLTGIIASFIGQGIDAYKASILGVYCHGLAGDIAKEEKGEYGMIARDILESIPSSIMLVRN
jgi:holo-[acyl-carrier-protein] synthase